MKACKFLRIAFNLLEASLINVFQARSSSLDGRPDLYNTLVLPYTFHFLMIVQTVLRGTVRAFEIFFVASPNFS